jgi:hypothetical protein
VVGPGSGRGDVVLPPFIGVALLTRRRAGWRATGAIAASGTAIAGYLLLDAVVRAVLPDTSNLHGEDAGAAAMRLGVLVAVAALATIPWPVTGALGDSLTSLSLAFQTLARIIPQVLLFWGVIFYLLTSTFARPWAAALMTTLLYGVSTLGRVLPTADWSELGNGILLLPLANCAPARAASTPCCR